MYADISEAYIIQLLCKVVCSGSLQYITRSAPGTGAGPRSDNVEYISEINFQGCELVSPRKLYSAQNRLGSSAPRLRIT